MSKNNLERIVANRLVQNFEPKMAQDIGTAVSSVARAIEAYQLVGRRALPMLRFAVSDHRSLLESLVGAQDRRTISKLAQKNLENYYQSLGKRPTSILDMSTPSQMKRAS